jgi:hypothetical protein
MVGANAVLIAESDDVTEVSAPGIGQSRDAVDGTFDVRNLALQGGRELVHGALDRFARLGVRCTEPLQVGDERVGRLLDVDRGLVQRVFRERRRARELFRDALE